MGKASDCTPGDYIDCGDVDILNGATAITMACWLNVDSSAATNKNPYFISKWDAFATFNYYFSLDGTGGNPGLEFGVRNGSNYFINRVSLSEYTTDIYDLLIPGAWNHLACTWDYNGGSPQYAIYINGSAMTNDVRSSSGTVTSVGDQTNNLWFGILESGAAAQYSLNGKMAHAQIWDRALSASDIADVMKNPAYQPTNLVGWWPLSDANDIGVDLSSNGNDGTNSGFAVQADGPPLQISGGSGEFVLGLNQYLERTTTGPFDDITDYPFSICGWINASSSGSTLTIASLGKSDVDNVVQAIGITSARKAQAFSANGGAFQYAIGATTLAVDNWHFVTGVFTSATDRKIFVNAAEDGSDTNSVTYNSAIDKAGVSILSRLTNAQPFDGKLAHMQIYDKALSTDEQANIMLNPLSGPLNNLIWYLPMDKPGDCGRDLSDNKYDATAYNSPMTTYYGPEINHY